MAVAIALADDSVIVREGVARVLAAQPDMEVVVSCGDLPSLLEAVASERPDVVVTDIRMPPTGTDEGIRAAVLLREQHPDIGVVVLSNYADPAYAMALLESGSEGRAYLLKERIHDRAQLVAAIESVAAGGSVLDAKIVEPLVAAKVRVERSPLAALTAREREVLAEIAKGKSNAAIADTLVPHQAGGREAHQLDLPQTQPRLRRGRQQARQGHPALPRQRRPRGLAPDRPGRALRGPAVLSGRALSDAVSRLFRFRRPHLLSPRRSPRGAYSPRTAAPSLSEAQAE